MRTSRCWVRVVSQRWTQTMTSGTKYYPIIVKSLLAAINLQITWERIKKLLCDNLVKVFVSFDLFALLRTLWGTFILAALLGGRHQQLHLFMILVHPFNEWGIFFRIFFISCWPLRDLSNWNTNTLGHGSVHNVRNLVLRMMVIWGSNLDKEHLMTTLWNQVLVT
jgi:hypothetical protein